MNLDDDNGKYGKAVFRREIITHTPGLRMTSFEQMSVAEFIGE